MDLYLELAPKNYLKKDDIFFRIQALVLYFMSLQLCSKICDVHSTSVELVVFHIVVCRK